MRARPELRKLLHGAISIAQETGPQDYVEHVATFLKQNNVTAGEINWISPRLTAYVTGAHWGYHRSRSDSLNLTYRRN